MRRCGGLRCSGNPATGDEARWGEGTLTRVPSRKKVLIIGAGPAGLECARTLAERGHEPVIYEKGKEIGGQMRLRSRLPGEHEIGYWIDWADRQLQKLGVKVNLELEVNEKNLEQVLEKERPDEVVVATGARPCRDGRSGMAPLPIPGAEEYCFTCEDVFAGAELRKRAIVLGGISAFSIVGDELPFSGAGFRYDAWLSGSAARHVF